jgi:hypothetical protein
MAYNNRNFLERIIEIQNITLEYKAKGCTQEWIFRKLIRKNYKISRGTFYRYLAMPAKADLTKNLVLCNNVHKFVVRTQYNSCETHITNQAGTKTKGRRTGESPAVISVPRMD